MSTTLTQNEIKRLKAYAENKLKQEPHLSKSQKFILNEVQKINVKNPTVGQEMILNEVEEMVGKQWLY